MKKVTLHYYSAINLGDDLFVKIIADRYKNAFFVPYRSKHRVFKNITNVRTSTSFIRNLINRLKSRVVGHRETIDADSLGIGDLIIYAGGSIFIEEDDLSRWNQDRDFFLTVNKPYYILGSNIGPYKTQEFLDLAKDIMRNASDVCLRDKSSYSLVDSLGNVRIAPDMVFGLDVQPYKSVQEKMAIFSIIDANSRFDSNTANLYESEMIKLTRDFISKGYKVNYVSFCAHEGDEKAITRIMERFSEEERDTIGVHCYRGDIDSSLRLISSSSIVVATRFHATILGLLFGKKILPVAYSDKMINVLNDMKFTGPIIDIRKLSESKSEELDIEHIKGMDVSHQVKDAAEHFKILDRVLEKRS